MTTTLCGDLQVYSAGQLTVLGFGGRDVLDGFNVAHCRDRIYQLVEQHECDRLAFDLSGVTLIPSGLLGLMASLQKSGLEVHVYNPSDDVIEVLQVTNLEHLLEVHQVEL